MNIDVRPGDAEPPRATSRPRARGWRVLAMLALGAGLAVAGYLLWPRPAAPPAPTPIAGPTPVLTVPLTPAATRPISVPVMGDGSVAAWQELVLGAEIGGLRVQEMRVEEGDRVAAGDLLVRLEDGVLAAQAAQAEASIAEARAALALARSEVARAQTLASNNVGSRQVLEQREANAAQAEARLAAAVARRDEAAARLAQTRIAAPDDGFVSRVAVRIGAVTGAGQELLRLVRDGRLELNARVPELDLAGVAPGQPALVRHGGQEIQGEVRAIAPVVTPESRLGLVHIALPEGAGLRPGMFARAEILGPARPAVVVPAAAVVFRDGAPAVFTVPEDAAPGAEVRVAQRRLALGQRLDGQVEVLEGLTAGERVVLSGAGFLSDGDLVRVARP